MKVERLQLVGLDRARYFMPTAICLYLGVVCSVLVITSAFLVHLQNAVAVAATGVFGLLLSCGLGCAFWTAQRRELQFIRVPTGAAAEANYAAVRAAMQSAGWRIVREEPARRLEAQASVLLLDEGERITVQFRDGDVLIACICDPGVGFSLAGRRHCAAHRDHLRRALAAAI
jgi:hypothetical protein